MARRIPVRGILRLRASGLSGNAIARTQSVSKTSVMDTFHAADEKGVSRDDVEPMSDSEAYALPFPERVHDGPVYADPDWEHVHRELARVGVTLKRLHAEYRDEQMSKGGPFMPCDRFCKRYREFTVRKQVVSRVGHRAGRILEVDWAGPTMALVGPAMGEVSKVYPFVARLPFSRCPASSLRRA
ncbi:transposase [Collinsella ihumii]|uniref:transposase n=1 Tax=Collinsella ihumii TaxID=1720204 RepID=UPI00082EAC48|nr:transposase [Collinsella ihumii]